MWSKVRSYIKKHNLLDDNELYLVALSGGADSVALLLLLKEAGYNIRAAHCNFHLRGEESDRDETFCMTLCKSLGIELHRAHFDTRTYAELHSVSIEMAARELRYQWFEQLRKDLGAAGICVAHHRDDSVETVLLNLVRGTGLRGLTGIRPRNGYILRPLLCVSRADIERFLAERRQEYVTDSTNLEASVLRNKVRLQLLPLLRELNPAVSENILRTADNLAEAQQVLNGVIEKHLGSNELNLNELGECHSSEYVTFEWLKKYGFNGHQVRQILAAETGSIISSSAGFDVLVDRGRLLVEPSLKPMKPMLIPEPGTYRVDEHTKMAVRKCGAYVSTEPQTATVDAAKALFPLTVRRVAAGDKMKPYGMRGHKLLSDLMTDLKMTAFEKRRQLVVADANGDILWAAGLRVGQQAAVTKSTDEVVEMRIFAIK